MQPIKVAGIVFVAAVGASVGYALRHQPLAAASISSDPARCAASKSSMTPSAWTGSGDGARARPAAPLHVIANLPLPGPASRFDYQSIDSARRRLYISHMNAGRLIVFDLDSSKVIANVDGVPRATGVWAVPAQHRIFVSAAGLHQLVAFDDQTLKVVGRVSGIRFPDGIAYAPLEERIFVSDESGEADVSIDAATMTKLSTIALGGEAGNTHYDSVSHCILVAVQTQNQVVAIDPATERLVWRYDLPGSDEPHGFVIDEPGRLAFVSGEGNGLLQVVDLRTMRVIATYQVGSGPDVLAWDAAYRRLYVASESGVVTIFDAARSELTKVGEVRAPHAHTISADPLTHRVYLPLENVGGRPMLRIMGY